MKRFLLAAAAVLAAAAPAAAQSLAEVTAHLEALDTMVAGFTQTSSRGGALAGTLTLARPGKARFEYRGAPMLIVADGRAVNLIDYEVRQVSSWPIRGTPLAVLLEPATALPRIARVLPDAPAGEIRVEARDPSHPEYGVTVLRFLRDSAAPGGLRLGGWRVTDAQGVVTLVELEQPRYNVPVKSAVFRFRDPRPRPVPGKG